MPELLVSAIMPTRGRQVWAAQAVGMFLRQTWARKELVIVDDPADPSFPDPSELPEGVRYLRHDAGIKVGDKMNIAAAEASGPLLICWDSDDLYSPDRIEHQMRSIDQDVDLAGFRDLLFYDIVTADCWRYRGAPGNVLGASMLFWKRVWEAHPFASRDAGYDVVFRRKLCRVNSEIPDRDRIIARMHEGNVSGRQNRLDSIRRNPAQWRPDRSFQMTDWRRENLAP